MLDPVSERTQEGVARILEAFMVSNHVRHVEYRVEQYQRCENKMEGLVR